MKASHLKIVAGKVFDKAYLTAGMDFQDNLEGLDTVCVIRLRDHYGKIIETILPSRTAHDINLNDNIVLDNIAVTHTDSASAIVRFDVDSNVIVRVSKAAKWWPARGKISA